MAYGTGLSAAAASSLARLASRPSKAERMQAESISAQMNAASMQREFISQQRDREAQRQTNQRNFERNARAEDLFQQQQYASAVMERQNEMAVDNQRTKAAFTLQNTMARRGKGVSAQPGGTQQPIGGAGGYGAAQTQNQTLAEMRQEAVQSRPLNQSAEMIMNDGTERISYTPEHGMNRDVGDVRNPEAYAAGEIEMSPVTRQGGGNPMSAEALPETEAKERAKSPYPHVREGYTSTSLNRAYETAIQDGKAPAMRAYEDQYAEFKNQKEELIRDMARVAENLRKLNSFTVTGDMKENDPQLMRARYIQNALYTDLSRQLDEHNMAYRATVPVEELSANAARQAVRRADMAYGEENRDTPEYELAVQQWLHNQNFTKAAKVPPILPEPVADPSPTAAAAEASAPRAPNMFDDTQVGATVQAYGIAARQTYGQMKAVQYRAMSGVAHATGSALAYAQYNYLDIPKAAATQTSRVLWDLMRKLRGD